jgi:2-polyprenyl-3-methyl-5-hydroxy-6-metoxy-1,4-benzoquinol methylase
MAGTAERRPDELAERLGGAALGAYELLTVYLGERLGLYRVLSERGALTPAELADAAGIHSRYAREWLEQQAVAGILEVAGERSADERRYRLPATYEEVLLDPESLLYIVPMARFAATFATVVPKLDEAFRTGGGVPWSEFGTDGLEAQGAANRPQFAKLLGSEWLPAIPDVHERLHADPPAAVADMACGVGWSSIAIAQAYPLARVDGFDVDEPSVERAGRNAAEAGLSDRVRFHVTDATEPDLAGRYDLVTIFEALHDMSRPVEALQTARALAGSEGAVLVVDERVADEFAAPGDETERLMYTYSVLCCLAVGMSETPSAQTGTVMRPETMRRYAFEAGFADVEVVPIEHDFFRFYRLRREPATPALGEAAAGSPPRA